LVRKCEPVVVKFAFARKFSQSSQRNFTSFVLAQSIPQILVFFRVCGIKKLLWHFFSLRPLHNQISCSSRREIPLLHIKQLIF
jgi:hypothetical protein